MVQAAAGVMVWGHRLNSTACPSVDQVPLFVTSVHCVHQDSKAQTSLSSFIETLIVDAADTSNDVHVNMEPNFRGMFPATR